MRKAHSDGVIPPLGEFLRRHRGARSQDEAALEIAVSQPRYQRWESMGSDVDDDRELHERIREALGLDRAEYAQAVLEHGIIVKELRLKRHR